MPPLDGHEAYLVSIGSHSHPHRVLGPHHIDAGVLVRVLRPLAESVTLVIENGGRLAMAHVSHGIWEALAIIEPGAYQVEATYDGGSSWTSDDPYRFWPTVGELDLYLFGEGRHENLWRMLGSHVVENMGVLGTSFAVWAPHAQAVRIKGDFNGWYGVAHAMRRMDGNGIWELFVPGLTAGTYKYEILYRRRPLGRAGRPDGAPGRDPSGDRIGDHEGVPPVGGRRRGCRRGRASSRRRSR